MVVFSPVEFRLVRRSAQPTTEPASRQGRPPDPEDMKGGGSLCASAPSYLHLLTGRSAGSRGDGPAVAARPLNTKAPHSPQSLDEAAEPMRFRAKAALLIADTLPRSAAFAVSTRPASFSASPRSSTLRPLAAALATSSRSF